MTDKGEGANHAIVDVLDFMKLFIPHLGGGEDVEDDEHRLRAALDRYEDKVVLRTRSAVLASRQACLDTDD